MKTIWQIPVPSTSLTEGVGFKVLPKRIGSLVLSYERQNHIENTELTFKSVASFKCTYLSGLTVEMIETAYDRLVEIEVSPWLDEINSIELRRGDLNDLRHFRITFDDGPCYEFICADVEISSS